MDWEPRVGMRVVCLRNPKPEVMKANPGAWPFKGGVYTIKTVNHWPEPHGTLLTFLELDNSHMVGWISKLEPGFSPNAFRPLDEHRLDIFRAVLTKAPTPEKEPA